MAKGIESSSFKRFPEQQRHHEQVRPNNAHAKIGHDHAAASPGDFFYRIEHYAGLQPEDLLRHPRFGRHSGSEVA